MKRSVEHGRSRYRCFQQKSTIAVLHPFGEVVKVPFGTSHTAEGLASLAQQLKAIGEETRVVMEYTDRYYECAANVLFEAGLYVRAVNPLLIKLRLQDGRCEQVPAEVLCAKVRDHLAAPDKLPSMDMESAAVNK